MYRNFRGQVTDSQGNPLQGAHVRIVGENKIVPTDSHGFFSIWASVNQEMEITHLGYAPRIIQLKPSIFFFHVVMEQTHIELDEVVVTHPNVTTTPSHNGKVQTSKTWFWLTLVALGGAIGWYALSPKPAKKVDM